MSAALDIIIVNWNAGIQLRGCLDSILAARRDGFELDRVVVVDNASEDGSANRLDGLDLPLVIQRNQENRGFAAAANQGTRSSHADYLLFLNPDTRLYIDSLATPLAYLDRPENTGVGIVGIQLVDETGRVHRSCARLPTPGRYLAMMAGLDRLLPGLFPSHFMAEWDHQDSREVDQVIGAFFLVRRTVFEALDGFDERFFVYFEDVDFALRARKAGWRSYYLATARAYHRGGGTTEEAKALRLAYNLRGRILYSFKHFGQFSAALVTLATLLVEPVSRVVLAMARRSPTEALDTLRGYARLWSEVPTLLKTARKL